MEDDLCIPCGADANVGTSWGHHVEEVGKCGELRGQRSSRRRVEVQIVYLAPRFGREDGDKSCGKCRGSSF